MLEKQYSAIGNKIIRINNYYWIISCTTNAIWKCDLLFNVVDYCIFEEEYLEKDLFRAVVAVDEIIYLFPFNANNAYSFDTNSNSIKKLNIDFSPYSTRNEKFQYAFIVGNSIIACGRTVPGLIKYDIDTGTEGFMSYDLSSCGEFCSSFSNGIINNNVYLVSILKNAFLAEIDIKKNKIKWHDMSDYCENNLNTISSYDNHLYITNDRQEVIKLDAKLNVVEIVKLGNLKDSSIRAAYFGLNRKWYLGNTSGDLLIDENGAVNILCIDNEIDERYGYIFSSVEVFGDEAVVQLRKNGSIICVNLNEKVKKEHKIKLCDVLMEKYKTNYFKILFDNSYLTMYEESNSVSLESYIMAIK